MLLERTVLYNIILYHNIFHPTVLNQTARNFIVDTKVNSYGADDTYIVRDRTYHQKKNFLNTINTVRDKMCENNLFCNTIPVRLLYYTIIHHSPRNYKKLRMLVNHII